MACLDGLFNSVHKNGADRVGISNSVPSVPKDCGAGLGGFEPTLTKVQFADECDLSKIIQRFMKTGQLPQSVARTELTSTEGMPDDFFELQQNLINARSAFDLLPLDVRNRFNNDAEAYYIALGDHLSRKASLDSKTLEKASKDVSDGSRDTPPSEDSEGEGSVKAE